MKSKLFKKLIAVGAAAAMTAQLGFVIPVSAASIYSQDYENVGSIAEVWSSQNAQGNLTLETDKTKYAKYTNDMSSSGGSRQNSRSSYTDFSVDLTGKDAYVVEFDLALSAGSQDASQFAIRTGSIPKANTSLSGDYLLNMTAPGNSNVWTINGVESSTVTLPAGEWCHYTYYVDHAQSLASLTITSESGESVADKMLVPVPNAPTNVTGLYYLNGRYYANMMIDNILFRDVESTDEFGQMGEEVMASAEFVSAPTIINQPAEGESVDAPITVYVKGSYGNDLTDKATIKWSWIGNEYDDGYVTITPDGATCNVNVRNGVSNYYIIATAEVTYGDVTQTISAPFAVIGATSSSSNQIIPAMGYPVNMDDYPDTLVGYYGTSQGLNTQDVILNNWSIYGSNGSRTLRLVEHEGKKAIEFASNGGGGTTVPTYQWPTQQSQYIVDMTVYVADGANYGTYTNTPNNPDAIPEWSFTTASGSLTAGSESIPGVNAGEWCRFVVSADPSVGTYNVTAYKEDGTLLGSTADVAIPENTSGKSVRYLCVSGAFPSYINSLSAYNPSISKLSVASSADIVKVPEAGEDAATLDFTANCSTSDDINITGAVTWSLADEYANVELTSTGAQTAVLTVKEGASGSVEVIATKDGVSSSKTVQLTTSSDVVSFTASTSSITIPFDGEENVSAKYEAVTLDKDGHQVTDKAITYDLLAKDGVNPASLKGVTFENGTLTVAPGANPGVVYVRATNSDGLANRVRVNIHGLSFAFGSGEPEEGYTQVTNTAYTSQLGYGFSSTDNLTVNPSDVSGSSEFRFKANVPNGNYTVEVNTTAASMKSEVVETVSASTGIPKSGSTFLAAVCDGVLDLTFPADSSVTTLNISQVAAKTPLKKPKLYAIGDSTTSNSGAVKDDPLKRTYCSWANSVASERVALPDVFSGFSNNGRAGRDSVNFYNEALLETVLLNVNPGDYVTVNMGINSKEAGEGNAYYTMMRDYYVQGIIQRGATPIILTATPDGPGYGNSVGSYDPVTGKFSVACLDRARNPVLRQIAEEFNLDVVEVGQLGEDYLNSLTMDDVAKYNEEYGQSFTSVYDMVHYWQPDHNHYIEPLSTAIATYILEEVAKLVSSEQPEPLDVTYGQASMADGAVTIPVTTSGEGTASANVFVAQYDKDGVLIDSVVEAQTVTQSTTELSVKVTENENAASIILYIWDKDMTPQTNAQTLKK